MHAQSVTNYREFRVNDLAVASDDKSDRRSNGENGKVACRDAVTVTRHVAYIDTETRSGLHSHFMLRLVSRCVCVLSVCLHLRRTFIY